LCLIFFFLLQRNLNVMMQVKIKSGVCVLDTPQISYEN